MTAPRPSPSRTACSTPRTWPHCLVRSGRRARLPSAAYTDPRVLAWKRRNLFAGSWTCVGRDTDLRADGVRQRATTVGDVPRCCCCWGDATRPAARLRHQRLPTRGTSCWRTAACSNEPVADLPVPRVDVRARRVAARRARLPQRPRSTRRRTAAWELPLRRVARLACPCTPSRDARPPSPRCRSRRTSAPSTTSSARTRPSACTCVPGPLRVAANWKVLLENTTSATTAR